MFVSALALRCAVQGTVLYVPLGLIHLLLQCFYFYELLVTIVQTTALTRSEKGVLGLKQDNSFYTRATLA
jgi:hypothetical protein